MCSMPASLQRKHRLAVQQPPCACTKLTWATTTPFQPSFPACARLACHLTEALLARRVAFTGISVKITTDAGKDWDVVVSDEAIADKLFSTEFGGGDKSLHAACETATPPERACIVRRLKKSWTAQGEYGLADGMTVVSFKPMTSFLKP